MNKNLKRIDDDLFGIAIRLREIDDGYFLVYNLQTNRYEVHNSKNVGNTLSLVCAYDTLDFRLVRDVLRTRRDRASELIAEIEEHNQKLENDATRAMSENAKDRAKEIIQKRMKECG